MGNTVVIMNHKSYDKYEIYYLGPSNIQSHENWRHTKYILNKKLLLYLHHTYYSIPCFSKPKISPISGGRSLGGHSELLLHCSGSQPSPHTQRRWQTKLKSESHQYHPWEKTLIFSLQLWGCLQAGWGGVGRVNACPRLPRAAPCLSRSQSRQSEISQSEGSTYQPIRRLQVTNEKLGLTVCL